MNFLAENLFGWKEHELAGKPIGELVPKQFRGKHTSQMHEYFKHPYVKNFRRELVGVQKNGLEFPVNVVLVPSNKYVLCICRDLSEVVGIRDKLMYKFQELEKLIRQEFDKDVNIRIETK
jgi:PAS domain S-box-containing protein